MKSTVFTTIVALVLLALVTPAVSAQTAPALTVAYWGQSQINEDGNLRFRIDSSVNGITGITCPDSGDLQLWAYVLPGRGTDPGTPNGAYVLIKSKDACNAYNQPAKAIMGTSIRFPLARGPYTFYVFVVVNTSMTLNDPATVTAASALHLGGIVTLP